jgi:hypothetical protein
VNKSKIDIDDLISELDHLHRLAKNTLPQNGVYRSLEKMLDRLAGDDLGEEADPCEIRAIRIDLDRLWDEIGRLPEPQQREISNGWGRIKRWVTLKGFKRHIFTATPFLRLHLFHRGDVFGHVGFDDGSVTAAVQVRIMHGTSKDKALGEIDAIRAKVESEWESLINQSPQ